MQWSATEGIRSVRRVLLTKPPTTLFSYEQQWQWSWTWQVNVAIYHHIPRLGLHTFFLSVNLVHIEVLGPTRTMHLYWTGEFSLASTTYQTIKLRYFSDTNTCDDLRQNRLSSVRRALTKPYSSRGCLVDCISKHKVLRLPWIDLSPSPWRWHLVMELTSPKVWHGLEKCRPYWK